MWRPQVWTAAAAVVPGRTRLGQPSPVAQRQWRSGPGRTRTGSRNPGHRTLSRSSVGSWGWSRTAGGRGSMAPILVPATGSAVYGPDGGGQWRMSPNSAPAPPDGRNWWGPRWQWSPTTTLGLLLTRGGRRRAYSARCGRWASQTAPQLDSHRQGWQKNYELALFLLSRLTWTKIFHHINL
jgi:hypothetical protein